MACVPLQQHEFFSFPGIWEVPPFSQLCSMAWVCLQHEFFSGPELVEVPPGSKVPYPITYRPLTMTAPDAMHEGTVFFPLPDGSGLQYKLLGRASAPAAEAKVGCCCQLALTCSTSCWAGPTCLLQRPRWVAVATGCKPAQVSRQPSEPCLPMHACLDSAYA